MKPKILISIDVPGWALERTANNVTARLKERYNFEKTFNKGAAAKIKKGHFDLLYITYWRQFMDAGIQIDLPKLTITGVRSHFKWDGGKGLPPSAMLRDTLKQYVALHVPSLILYNIFKDLHQEVFYTPHGVDAVLFQPKKNGPFSSSPGKLVLGWAGSLKNHPGKRGLEDYLLPAIENLAGVTLKIAAREEKWRSQTEMVSFYQNLDAYICASRTEGGPHPLLEAAACGIPLISTRVGIAPELIKHNENGFLIDRDIEAIRNAVVKLRDNQALRIELGKRAREIIEEGWTWDIQARHYIPFFERGLEGLQKNM